MEVWHNHRRAAMRDALSALLVHDTIELIWQFAQQTRLLMLEDSRLPLLYDPSMGQWEELGGDVGGWLADMSMSTRAGAFALLDGMLHACGRRHAKTAELLQVHTGMDLATGVHRHVASLPPGSNVHQVVAVQGKLFGLSRSAWPHPLLCFDPSKQLWSVRTPHSQPRLQPAIAALGHFVYMIGGSGNALTDLQVDRYDTITDTWAPCAPLGTFRGGCAVASTSHAIYACGGTNAVGYLASCEVYDPECNVWNNIASMSLYRRNATATFIDGALLVCGGDVTKRRARNLRYYTIAHVQYYTIAHVERYDTKTDRWSYVTPMPRTLSNGTAILVV
jgi:hypothetical protein